MRDPDWTAKTRALGDADGQNRCRSTTDGRCDVKMTTCDDVDDCRHPCCVDMNTPGSAAAVAAADGSSGSKAGKEVAGTGVEDHLDMTG